MSTQEKQFLTEQGSHKLSKWLSISFKLVFEKSFNWISDISSVLD